MSRYELRQFNDPALYVVCREVTPEDDVGDLVQAMMAVMLEHDGIGLAAPQVGSGLRVIIVGRKSDSGNTFQVMVNPKVEKRSEQSWFAYEGCLSYPGVSAWVNRRTRVKVSYADGSGRAKRSMTGHEARVFQHELDHLDGICRVGDEWRRQLIRTPSAEAIRCVS